MSDDLRAELESLGSDMELLMWIERIARIEHGGHFTILSFTTHYKVGFGTPELYSGDGFEQVSAMKGYPTLREAMIECLMNRTDFFEVYKELKAKQGKPL